MEAINSCLIKNDDEPMTLQLPVAKVPNGDLLRSATETSFLNTFRNEAAKPNSVLVQTSRT